LADENCDGADEENNVGSFLMGGVKGAMKKSVRLTISTICITVMSHLGVLGENCFRHKCFM